jgi:AraC-like DNA-binding protein
VAAAAQQFSSAGLHPLKCGTADILTKNATTFRAKSYRRHFEITMDTQNSSVPSHILVVDDDPAMRRLEFGYRIAHPDVSHLARIAGLSTSHFCRAFKQSIGMPPHRYVTMRRLAAAAELIRKTPKPLAEVAIEVGFSGQSHFTRVFTQMTGETPGALRRRYP